MPATVGARAARVNYQPNGSVMDRVAKATMVGRAASARQMLKPSNPVAWQNRTAAAVRVLVDAGQRPEAEAIARPVLDALEEGPAPELCPALLIDEADADARLSRSRARYLIERSNDAAHQLAADLLFHEAKARLVNRAMTSGMQSA